MKKVNLFIVGAPKCGTTSLYHFLKGHPDIFFPEDKEPTFFVDDIRLVGNVSTLTEYNRLYETADSKVITGDASTTYFFSKTAPNLIYNYNPDAKIIIMLRQPAEMMYSLYCELKFGLTEDKETFEEALAAETQRETEFQYQERRPAYFYRYIASYFDKVESYFRLFGRENVHVIIFEDFISKELFPAQFEAIMRFLKIDTSYKPELKNYYPYKEYRSKTIARFVISQPDWLRSVGRLFVPKQYRPHIMRTVQRLNTRFTKKKPMLKSTRSAIINEKKDEIIALAKLLDKDLSFWLT